MGKTRDLFKKIGDSKGAAQQMLFFFFFKETRLYYLFKMYLFVFGCTGSLLRCPGATL